MQGWASHDLSDWRLSVLANGSEGTFDIHVATIVWDGMPRSILVEAVDVNPLVGMRLLAGYDIRLTASPGGIIQIVPSGETGETDLS
jgi:predicted aspartyl protease